MKNKLVIIILGVLFIISLILGIIGLLNKGIKPNKPLPQNDKVKIIEFNNEVRDVVGLRDKIANYEFVKANRDFSSSYLNLTIDGNNIKIDVQKSGIRNADESVSEIITYTIKDIENPVAVQAQMSSEEGNTIHVYTLDSYGRMYLSILDADPSFYNEITTYVFNIDNVISFISLTVPLRGEVEIKQNYVIFRTEDNLYYSDYKFEESDDIMLTRVNTVASGPEEE